MGVQKSRKSIKFTKFSLKQNKNTKKLTKIKNKSVISKIINKHLFKKTNIFFLNKFETNKTLFF